MKRGLFFVGLLVICGVLYGMGRENPSQLMQAIADGSIVRLHVVAAGDDPGEQQTKLLVRDAVIKEYGPLLEQADSSAQMEDIIRQSLPQIEQTAKASAASHGYDGPVNAQWGVFPFPDREYAGELVPAGEYRALRIVLGDGQGANWWCVMYPPLCYVGEEAIEPGEKVMVKFESSIAKWWKDYKEKKAVAGDLLEYLVSE